MIKRIAKKIYDTDPFLPIILLGAIIRGALFYWAGEDGIEFLVNRIEISTPVNSYKQIKEGVYLFNNSIDPYEGNVFYQSPLLLMIFSLFQNLPLKFLFGIYVQLDIIIGYTLYRLGVMYIFNNPSLLPVFNNDNYLLGMLMGSIYLLNPFTILSTLGLSTSIFQNFAIVIAISNCYQGFPNGGMMMLSFATCLGFYPVSLIFPLYLITYKSESTRTWWNFLNFIFFYTLWMFGLTRLCFFFMNDWKFLSQSIGSILFPPDLTPNIGLHWYINIEVFDHFRSFFNSTFQLYSFFFVIPLSIKFRNLPFFVIFLQLGIISTFKSYPSIADFALYTSFLPLFYETFEYLNNTFVIGTALIFCCGLGPLFWEGWVQLETANANFFYAITLVYAICNILLLCSSLQARLKFDYLKINPHHKDANLKFE